jgi:hypothetical protein
MIFIHSVRICNDEIEAVVSLDTSAHKIPRLVMPSESLTPVFVAPAVTPSVSGRLRYCCH